MTSTAVTPARNSTMDEMAQASYSPENKIAVCQVYDHVSPDAPYELVRSVLHNTLSTVDILAGMETGTHKTTKSLEFVMALRKKLDSLLPEDSAWARMAYIRVMNPAYEVIQMVESRVGFDLEAWPGELDKVMEDPSMPEHANLENLPVAPFAWACFLRSKIPHIPLDEMDGEVLKGYVNKMKNILKDVMVVASWLTGPGPTPSRYMLVADHNFKHIFWLVQDTVFKAPRVSSYRSHGTAVDGLKDAHNMFVAACIDLRKGPTQNVVASEHFMKRLETEKIIPKRNAKY